MTWLWDAIAGCSAPGMNLLAALVIRAGSLFFGLITGIMQLLNWFLSISILNIGNAQSLASSMFGTVSSPSTIMLAMDGLGMAIAVTGLLWAALHFNVASLGGARRDEFRALLGRTGAALAWMVATPLTLYVLLSLNNALVTDFVSQINQNALLAPPSSTACNAGQGFAHLGMTVIAGLSGAILWYFFDMAIVLALVIGVIVAFGQYFLRLFQVIFWGLLLPPAAGLSVGDPQRRAWTYVWGNVQGAIFTQLAMAFGIFITEAIMLGHGSSSGVLFIVRFLVGVAGFFMVGRIPQYFQQMQGHAVGGGSEMGAIAGGYIMGRFGSQALQATRGGQEFNTFNESQANQHAAELGSPSSGSFWRHPIRNAASTLYRRSADSAAAAGGVVALQVAQRKNRVGATDSDVAAQMAQEQGQLDAEGSNPGASDTTAFTHPHEVLPPHSADAGPGTAAVGGVSPRPSPDPSPAPDSPTDSPTGFGATLASAAVPSLVTSAMLDTASSRPASGTSPHASPAVSASRPSRAAPGRPTIGPGSQLASTAHLSGAEFAAEMAPLALSFLRGQVRPARAADQRGAADLFMREASRPAPTTPTEAKRDAKRLEGASTADWRVMERAQELRHRDQQLQLHPQQELANLFGVAPEALDDPNMQRDIETQLRTTLVQGPQNGSPLGKLLKPQPTTDPGWATPL